MIDKLKTLLAGFTAAAPEQRQHTIELAAACLLIELCRADTNTSSDELTDISHSLGDMFSLDVEEVAELVQQAEEQADQATSTYEFTAVIKAFFDDQQRIKLISALWRAAFADGILDKYEEHYIRKVSELLYVSHSDFIRAKHQAQSNEH